MKKNKVLLFLAVFFAAAFCKADEPSYYAVYLTWDSDPQTTMIVRWITPKEDENDVLMFQRLGENGWLRAKGSRRPIPGLNEYVVHRVELKDLASGVAYRFQTPVSKRFFKFRTIPGASLEPFKFVVGGDVYHDDINYVRTTNRAAAATEPLFAIQGGDLAYAASKLSSGRGEHLKRWLEWLAIWKDTMETPEGYLIPMIPVVGNHDINGRYDQTSEQGTVFYTLFFSPGQKSYRRMDFGNILSLILLDSAHSSSIEEQALWLQQVMKENVVPPHRMAVYHIPAYPSTRKFEGKYNKKIREHWVPLFERYSIKTAFEHHEHAYKRTYPLLEGKINPEGVLFLGDGAWGTEKPRTPDTPKNRWYLAKSLKTRHFIAVSIQGGTRTFKAINDKGEVFDETEQALFAAPRFIFQ